MMPIPATESKEFDLLYPVLNYESYGREYRWQFCQLLSFAGGQSPKDDLQKRASRCFRSIFSNARRFRMKITPRSCRFTATSKTGCSATKFSSSCFPFTARPGEADVVTDNYLWPFFHLRHGDGLSGWQFWPLVGNEHKDVTTRTNGFNETEIIGGHDKFFALWPFYFDETTGIGTDNPEKWHASLLIYAQSRSPQRDYTSVIWPFFAWIDDRGGKNTANGSFPGPS
jgi:hypothetical protein